MSIPVIIMGAKGRMGSTLARLAMESDQFAVSGVVERAEYSSGLEVLGCPVAHDLQELLPSCPGATVIDFTAPEVSLSSARKAAKTGNPIVIGTTGLSAAQLAELETLAKDIPVFRRLGWRIVVVSLLANAGVFLAATLIAQTFVHTL